MDYLDYLPDTPYEELPADVKKMIPREEYAARQQLVTGILVTGTEALSTGLPTGLKQAYQKRQSVKILPEAIAPGAAGRVGKDVRKDWRYRLSLAASLFLAATTITLLLLPRPTWRLAGRVWQSKEKIIYQLVSAPVPEPVLLADTIYLDRTVEKVVYRDRVDTVTRYLPTEARYVYLTDTVYLPTPDSVPVANGSRPATRDTRLLDLLAPAD